jgi:2-polyprenyl-3-methyl-5-hydroxy-6-metoxy-1,4-benzoquinol methylase
MAEHFNKTDINYYNLVRTDVLKNIPEDLELNHVLEVGCGEGYTLEFLKTDRGAKHTTGIELFTDAAKSAESRVDVVINQSADETLDLPENYYDLILCLDVLEHLYDPWAVLSTLTHSLRPGGAVVASIPNVQHWSLVKMLLRGNWTYAKAGLMDQTHIRFFTQKSIRHLFNTAGLHVTKLDGQMGKDVRLLDILTLKFFHGFFSYQYFITAVKQEQ